MNYVLNRQTVLSVYCHCGREAEHVHVQEGEVTAVHALSQTKAEGIFILCKRYEAQIVDLFSLDDGDAVLSFETIGSVLTQLASEEECSEDIRTLHGWT